LPHTFSFTGAWCKLYLCNKTGLRFVFTMATTKQGLVTVLVLGACGKMGQEVVKTVLNDPELSLACLVDPKLTSFEAARAYFPTLPAGSLVFSSLAEGLTSLPASTEAQPVVAIDFTKPSAVFANTEALIAAGVAPVLGTTGLSPEQLNSINASLKLKHLAGALIPNFAIGAVLLMQFAKMASRFFDYAEIIELHHNQKADAPSGTAILTAQLMEAARTDAQLPPFGQDNAPEHEQWPAARGALHKESGLRVHSVRLPGLIAHQEVLLGAQGQLLTLRHDTSDRVCFMQGVALAAKAIVKQPAGLHVGLETLMDLSSVQ
jgi:4-hydroxy-tetrahydrodipicolinate reductase